MRKQMSFWKARLEKTVSIAAIGFFNKAIHLSLCSLFPSIDNALFLSEFFSWTSQVLGREVTRVTSTNLPSQTLPHASLSATADFLVTISLLLELFAFFGRTKSGSIKHHYLVYLQSPWRTTPESLSSVKSLSSRESSQAKRLQTDTLHQFCK